MLLDLPIALQADVIFRLFDPADVAALLATCRLFRDLVATIPWQLKLLSSDANPRAANWQRAALAMISSRMPLTSKLDLTRSSILAHDVTSLLGCLRKLDILILDSNQKLTSAVVDALAVCVRSGPRALSLQRCFALGSTATGNLLAATAADGSRLQCILLSHLNRVDLPRDPPLVEILAGLEKLQIRNPSGYGLKILALHNCGGFELSALAATCPLLEHLFLGGSAEAFGLARTEFITKERVIAAASAIIELANALKKLQVIELTFFTAELLQIVRRRLSGAVQVWDFCEKNSLVAALSVHRSEHFALAVRAASNCSDIRRRTPLHIAAALEDAASAALLVELGAAVTMRDTSGASALFVAAELGAASVCGVLLEGGADVFAKNNSGECPLYIAALKGNCEAVEIMLSRCHSKGLHWQKSSLYCDGWTPLMAAAVADRQEVGNVILRCNSTSSNCEELLNAQNRHGQTALHIVSRRASVWFVTNLLAAGSSVDVLDEYGQSPLDVAVRFGHQSVIEILGGDKDAKPRRRRRARNLNRNV